MSFLNVIKCAFCFKKSCPKRYQVGNRTYYSHLGFVRTECPKKLKNYSFLTMDEIREKAEKEAIERKKSDEEQEKIKVKKIVIVDDNSQYANALAEFIENPDKSECIVFTYPEVALNYFESNHADILLTDYEMPKMNGCELAKKVLERRPDIRIIIMTGHDISYIKKICKEHGINEKVEVICKSSTDIFSTLG